MRLAAQTKLGFYPAHPDAIAAIASHIGLDPRPPRAGTRHPGEYQILDPCAGEGLALRDLAAALGIPPDHRYAIELDAGRADKCRENLGEGANVLGPASFMGSRVQGMSFGIVYCNPPFDDELGGGGRMEATFARRATGMLEHGGLLVLVMPERTISAGSDLQEFLDTNFEDARLFAFPESCRPFSEVVYIGKRRRVEGLRDAALGPLSSRYGYRHYYSPKPEPLPTVGTGGGHWTVPRAWLPRFFSKCELTEQEKVAVVEDSPLLAALRPQPEAAKQRPPLPLYTGHVALLLASGMLNGVIEPEGEPPHVVRGTARKVEYLASTSETENEATGAVTLKQTFSQKIVLTVRAVGRDGAIKTFEDGGEKPVSGEAKA